MADKTGCAQKREEKKQTKARNKEKKCAICGKVETNKFTRHWFNRHPDKGKPRELQKGQEIEGAPWEEDDGKFKIGHKRGFGRQSKKIKVKVKLTDKEVKHTFGPDEKLPNKKGDKK